MSVSYRERRRDSVYFVPDHPGVEFVSEPFGYRLRFEEVFVNRPQEENAIRLCAPHSGAQVALYLFQRYCPVIKRESATVRSDGFTAALALFPRRVGANHAVPLRCTENINLHFRRPYSFSKAFLMSMRIIFPHL